MLPDPGPRDVQGDPTEPGGEAICVLQPVQPYESGGGALLHRVGVQVRIAQHTSRHRARHRLVAPDQQPERLFVPGPGAHHQNRIGNITLGPAHNPLVSPRPAKVRSTW